jgi:hypothetical protein
MQLSPASCYILLRLTYSLQQPVLNCSWYIFTHWSKTPNFVPMINCNLVYFVVSQRFVISSCISCFCLQWPFMVNKNISLLMYVGGKHICHFNTKLYLKIRKLVFWLGCGVDGPGFESWQEKKILFSSKCPSQVWCPPSYLFNVLGEPLTQG